MEEYHLSLVHRVWWESCLFGVVYTTVLYLSIDKQSNHWVRFGSVQLKGRIRGEHEFNQSTRWATSSNVARVEVWLRQNERYLFYRSQWRHNWICFVSLWIATVGGKVYRKRGSSLVVGEKNKEEVEQLLWCPQRHWYPFDLIWFVHHIFSLVIMPSLVLPNRPTAR